MEKIYERVKVKIVLSKEDIITTSEGLPLPGNGSDDLPSVPMFSELFNGVSTTY